LTSFVIDASVLAAWFLEEGSDPRVESAMEILARTGACAPIVLFFEIRNALLVGERRKRITEAQSDAFLRELALLRIRLESPREDSNLMLLARHRKLTVYDAAYLEPAKREALPLATLDRDLEVAARAERVVLLAA
jgi:predicted nucleic acid-binding protein